MLLAFLDNNITNKIVLWVAIAALASGVIMLLFQVILMSRKRKNGKVADQNNVTDDEQPEEPHKTSDNLVQEVLVMSRNVIYSVGIEEQIKPGKYRMNSADESESSFNLRLNGLVQEYTDGSTIYLAEGDTISPVSGSVVLEPDGD